jgi:hypothetical protein
MTIHNVDDVLAQRMNPNIVVPEKDNESPDNDNDSDSSVVPDKDDKGTDVSHEDSAQPERISDEDRKRDFQKDKEEFLAREKEKADAEKSPANDNEKAPDDKSIPNAAVDQYGMPIDVPKAPVSDEEKIYSSTDVNRMVRERLERAKLDAQPANQQQVQQAVNEGFKYDENNPDDWQVQLGNFVDTHLAKKQAVEHQRNQEAQRLQMQTEENARQAEFEGKFRQGMTKYKDFMEVTQNKPITNGIFLAIRDFQDPAGFLYAASKLHPQEIERISKIPNVITQGVELGKLEQRMLTGKNITRAPRPLTRDTGDVHTKEKPKRNIDSMIDSHAKNKRK